MADVVDMQVIDPSIDERIAKLSPERALGRRHDVAHGVLLQV